MFEEFVHKYVHPDDWMTLQGYLDDVLLKGVNRYNEIVVFVGSGGNGKSTFLRELERMYPSKIGHLNSEIVLSDDFGCVEFDSDIRLCQASFDTFSDRYNSHMKQLCEKHNVIVQTNGLTVSDPAMLQRLVVIRFPYVFTY